MKERILFVIAWIPKATIQAVLGSLVLDWSRTTLKDDNPHKSEYEEYGLQILTTGIISIFLTAPLGAILTENLGKRWLHKKVKEEKTDEIELGKPVDAVLPPIIEEVPEKAIVYSSGDSKSSKDSSREDEEEDNVQDPTARRAIMPSIQNNMIQIHISHDDEPHILESEQSLKGDV